MAEQATQLRSLSIEERRDLLSRMATGELTVTRYTNDGEIEESPGFNLRLAAIIELNRMDEKLPPPKPTENRISFPGRERFKDHMKKQGFTEEQAEIICREKEAKEVERLASLSVEGVESVVSGDG